MQYIIRSIEIELRQIEQLVGLLEHVLWTIEYSQWQWNMCYDLQNILHWP